MRILHVDTARGWRGGQNQVYLSSTGMAARGHAVGVACRAGGVLEKRALQAGLRVHSLPFGADLSPWALPALARLLLRERPQVVHLHDPHAVGVGLLACRLARTGRTVASRRVDFPLRGPFSRWKYLSCNRIIVASRAIGTVLESSGLPAAAFRLVYEGVVDRPPLPGGREALVELGVPEGCPVVGNVAALTAHKDQETLLAAAAHVLRRVQDVCFVIVGEGEERGPLEDQARSLGLEGHCRFTGFRTDLDRLLPSFTLFCLSSQLEGLGTSLLDAMAFGRPVVATAAGGIPEAVEDGVTGRLVPVRDPLALADALVELLRDAPRREAMGLAGRRRFEEKFTSERMVDETLRVYEELS